MTQDRDFLENPCECDIVPLGSISHGVILKGRRDSSRLLKREIEGFRGRNGSLLAYILDSNMTKFSIFKVFSVKDHI